ncbi:MAG: DUF2341 domain-containing protein [Pseudomonadota bacterium]
MRRLLLITLLLFTQASQAWWDEAWTGRKQLVLDTTASGVETTEALVNLPVLVRLHNGNFDFLGAKVDGSDLRFVAGDDKTPLKFHIEKFDSIAEMALVWVQVPQVAPGDKTQHIWMYWGNDAAPAQADAPGSYDTSHLAVFHFNETAGAPQDVTANGRHAATFSGARTPGAVIAGGLGFDGQQTMTLPAAGKLTVNPAGGLSVSLWVKPSAAAQTATLFRLGDLVLGLEGGKPYVDVAGVKSPLGAELAAGTWTHVALSAGAAARLYVNGLATGEAAAPLPALDGVATLGQGFSGEMDELQIAGAARSGDWFKTAALGQGLEARLVMPGSDEIEGEEGGGEASYFGVILQNVTLDGWIVIVILMVMLVISFLVMAAKGLVISKTDKANRQFIEAFRELGRGETDKLDVADDPEEADLKDSDLLTVLYGKHDHYQHASLYRIYHAGIQEIKHRVGDRTDANLSPQALDAIKASLDGTLVRENQKLNAQMVLLTIAISGGPFLGLLGTVVGVMITFAAIAATGDVNVAAIAPGIAAALVATVAGLAVAIPALFGYNYLGSRIKSISADMHVFVDEYLAKIAENYSR